MNKYESIIIIKPTLTGEEIKDTINKYKEYLKKFSDKPVEVEDLGKKKLAYEIKKNKEGNYAVFKFYGENKDLEDIKRNYRIDDNVMKFIIMKVNMELEETAEAVEDEENMEV